MATQEVWLRTSAQCAPAAVLSYGSPYDPFCLGSAPGEAQKQWDMHIAPPWTLMPQEGSSISILADDFNSLHWAAMLQAVAQRLPDLVPYVLWKYKDPTQL
jgi:hypothetical protein